MISPLRNCVPPYTLPSDIVYFHDWRYVATGNHTWYGEDNEELPLWSNIAEPIAARYRPQILPTGISLKLQQAQKTGPIIEPPMLDEIFLGASTVIHDDGLYRLWVECFPVEHLGQEGEKIRIGTERYVRYAESDNGIDWRFPKLGLIEHKGSKANNLVFGPPLNSKTGSSASSFFKDPSAPPAERYKMVYQGFLLGEEGKKYRKENPDLFCDSWYGDPEGTVRMLCGAVSADGLHWKPLDKPLNHMLSDTVNVCEYDPVLQQYVIYGRNWLYNRRGIGRTVSDNFREFPLQEDLLWPNAMMEPDETWYANAKTKMPGTTDYHVMFPMRWRILNDQFDFYLATSPDNVTWGLMPGGPICEAGQPGDWDCAGTMPAQGMVELPGDRIAIPLGGLNVPHKHPRQASLGFGVMSWATWPKGRLVALDAAVDGSFALWPLQVEKRSISLNFKTEMAGRIQLAVLDKDLKPLPGAIYC